MASRDDDLIDPKSSDKNSLFSEADSSFKTWRDVSPESYKTLSDRWSGRDASKSIEDRKTRYFKQYENDIFFIHDSEDPNSSHIVVRESMIGAHVKSGKIGIKITDNGSVAIQGNPSFTASGSEIVKGIYTENPLGMFNITGPAIGDVTPHTHGYQAAYLLRIPRVDMVKDIKSLFDKFCEFFKGATATGNPLP